MPEKRSTVGPPRSTMLDKIPHSPSMSRYVSYTFFRTYVHLQTSQNKHKWLTNAFHTNYSNVAHMFSITIMEVLKSINVWTANVNRGCELHKAETSFFSVIIFPHG